MYKNSHSLLYRRSSLAFFIRKALCQLLDCLIKLEKFTSVAICVKLDEPKQISVDNAAPIHNFIFYISNGDVECVCAECR